MKKLDKDLAAYMVKVMRRLIRPLGYKEARDHVLQSYRYEDTTEQEIRAYKRFLNQYFRRAVIAAAERRRLRVPLHVYEGDTR